MSVMKKQSINQLIARINRLQSIVDCRVSGITESNRAKLVEEIMNLIDHVGSGYVSEDYYASERYYSNIPGVKNLRFRDNGSVLVKIISPVGELVPNVVNVRGVEYRIIFTYSSKYDAQVDY